MSMQRWIRSLPRERQDEVLAQLGEASSPRFDFFVLVVLSCAIATFGLITDSAAVIIGAMLVAPLMSPILGLSLASVAGERLMFQRAAVALVQGAILAVALATAISWLAHLSPFVVLDELPREVHSRTHPNPFDLGVALAGGAAAAYALGQPKISAALPGVAIATALMPPLCTVGIGIALSDANVALGALLLFLTNFAAISFAGIAVFGLLGFRPVRLEDRWHGVPRSLMASSALVFSVTVPLVIFTLNVVSETRVAQAVREAVETEIAALPDAQLIEVSSTTEDDVLRLQVTVRTSRQLTYQEVTALQAKIATRLQRPVSLQLIDVPTLKLDPLIPPTFTATATLGPTATWTATQLPPTLTATATTTHTETATPTDTPTPTATFTPTPVLAVVVGSNGEGVVLRDEPDGKIVGFLPESAPVQILYQSKTVGNVVWIEVRDVLNRVGWLPAHYLMIKP